MENRKTRKRQNQMGTRKKETVFCKSRADSLSRAKAEIICKIIEKNHGFSPEQLPQTPYTKWFDYDIMNCNLEIRFREPGDYLVVDDSGHRQKLKSFFINEKIPAGTKVRYFTGRGR